MDQLIQYRRLIHLTCTNINPNNDQHTIQVRLEQNHPHSLFKYQIIKTKPQLINLYNTLQNDIFDFDNIFAHSFVGNLTHKDLKAIDAINLSLKECVSRIDVLTHWSFVQFLAINLHYPDFICCLREEENCLIKNNQGSKASGGQVKLKITNAPSVSHKETEAYCTDKPWLKNQQGHRLGQESSYKSQKTQSIKTDYFHKKQNEFDKMIDLVSCESQFDIQLQQKNILDFTQLRCYDTQLLFVLQQCKNTTKRIYLITQQKTSSKHSSTNNKSAAAFPSISANKTNTNESNNSLLTHPQRMIFNRKGSLLLILTSIGVNVYLAKMQHKFQQLQLFAYIQLSGICDFALSSSIGQVYMLRKDPHPQLHLYNFSKQKMMKTQFKYKEPSSICFEQHNNRLFVSDSLGIHIYTIDGSFEVRKACSVSIQNNFQRMFQSQGYLYAVSEEGFVNVLELKPLQKEKLISVVARIDLPNQTINLIGSIKNKRLIITNYRACLTLIDTIEGPIYSCHQKNGNIQRLYLDRQASRVLSITKEGTLTIFKVCDKII